jgi:hypothetical protein
MPHAHKRRRMLHVDPQFLAQFAPQPRERVFVLLEFAARKFPLAALVCPIVPTGDANTIVID